MSTQRVLSNILMNLFVYFSFMYWTDWGAVAKIERAYMSGNNRHTVVSGNLVWPNGLALDLSNRQMYWVDASLDKVRSCLLHWCIDNTRQHC